MPLRFALYSDVAVRVEQEIGLFGDGGDNDNGRAFLFSSLDL